MKKLIERPPDVVANIMFGETAQTLTIQVWYSEHGTYVHIIYPEGVDQWLDFHTRRFLDDAARGYALALGSVDRRGGSTLVPCPPKELPF